MSLFYRFLNNTSSKEHLSVIVSNFSICDTENNLNYVQYLCIATMVKAWLMAPMKYSSNKKGMVLWKIGFRRANHYGKKTKNTVLKETMSRKISFMHYVKWKRVNLLPVSEEFELVCIFLIFFSFHYHC